MNSRLVKACPASRIHGCSRAAAAMSATWCCRAWCSATCCARRTPMRAFARSTRAKAKAAPGVLAVLTGADWQASGWGDLPVPGGLKRRDGSVFRPPYPALVKDRVRWVGDYVAFVVAESLSSGAGRRRADRRSTTSRCPPRIDRGGDRRRRAAGLGRLPRQYRFRATVRRQGRDRSRPSPSADHVVQHRFVINRVTAASMEPRGCLGDYNATEDRYTIYTTLQRAHPFRAELRRF